ncbi:tumor necrosis factor receptor superfamily member 18 isoform X2 [Syngnathoides biaculeatus]|uniref:tumor necrosis factor receptor superfamily member 18 isoform X2 n=1 Tax=Syngnathoides biaculeatus TaxID=300417 RepID=UPI002ADD6296|nr:tumor necrosis factor receptor superfamily member 18 isoform X2 [Syngnathoides biaculeatus]
MNGRCCKLCPPGQYLKEFCTETTETVCLPCPDNSFSLQHNAFDKCTECHSCQGAHRERELPCYSTANAKCTCLDGFLCSDDACSQCVENNCDAGERAVKTGSVAGLRQYKCQSACPDHEYLDTKMNICKPKLQCKREGLLERFPGNTTHNAVCHQRGGMYKTNSASPVTENDSHLSKEESGLQQLIIQTDSSKSQLQEIVTALQ